MQCIFHLQCMISSITFFGTNCWLNFNMLCSFFENPNNQSPLHWKWNRNSCNSINGCIFNSRSLFQRENYSICVITYRFFLLNFNLYANNCLKVRKKMGTDVSEWVSVSLSLCWNDRSANWRAEPGLANVCCHHCEHNFAFKQNGERERVWLVLPLRQQ